MMLQVIVLQLITIHELLLDCQRRDSISKVLDCVKVLKQGVEVTGVAELV